MNKVDFINELRYYLDLAYGKLCPEDINDILRDYDEYFREGENEGKIDREMVEALGSPKHIVEELIDADIENCKYKTSDFVDFYNLNTSNKKIDYSNGKSTANRIFSIFEGSLKIIFFIILAIFDIGYFPSIIAFFGSIIGILLLGLVFLPAGMTIFTLIGIMRIFIIIPLIFIIGTILMMSILLYYTFIFGLKVNRKVWDFLARRGGRYEK